MHIVLLGHAKPCSEDNRTFGRTYTAQNNNVDHRNHHVARFTGVRFIAQFLRATTDSAHITVAFGRRRSASDFGSLGFVAVEAQEVN